MSEEKLCDACQKLLSGDRNRNVRLDHDETHHVDAESFRKALQLPCYLCCFIWAKPSQATISDVDVPDGTKYNLGGFANESSIIHLQLQIHSEGAYPLRLQRWEHVATKFQFPSLLSENTGSASALDFLISKYDNCIATHGDCVLQQTSPASYPSRLLDVGCLGDTHVFLRHTHQLITEGPYFCLSHCWGESQPLALTRETVKSLEEGIPLASLPKTFRDAVVVTRRSRTQYLWIDSLCIYQDNLDDWAAEASRMQTVYANAACTIAATAAKDSTQGLFFDRDPWLLRPRRLTTTWDPSALYGDEAGLTHSAYPAAGQYWCDHTIAWMHSIDHAPLNKRGWVSQERHLSRRIMHFAANQLYWECYQCKASENYPEKLPSWAFPSGITEQWSDPTPLKSQVHRLRFKYGPKNKRAGDHALEHGHSEEDCTLRADLDQLYLDWGQWREEYSRSAVTKDDDKLVAVQGIAQDVAQIFSDELVAGMWKGRIIEELCFRTVIDSEGVPRKLPAPSWSWASTDQRIVFGHTSLLQLRCTQLAELESLDVTPTKNGPLRWAVLRLRCHLVHAVATWVPLPPANAPLHGLQEWRRMFGDHPASGMKEFTLAQTRARWDFGAFGEELMELDDYFVDVDCRPPDIYLVVLRRCNLEFSNTAEALVLARCPGPEHVFERLGILEVNGDQYVQLLAEHEASKNQIISLV